MRAKQYSREQVLLLIAEGMRWEEHDAQRLGSPPEDLERLSTMMIDLGELAGTIRDHAPVEMADALVRIGASAQAWLESIPAWG